MTTANMRSRRILRPARCRRGTEVIELALLMLPLLWLTFGAIDYGFYFYLEHNLEAAAREGARKAVLASSTQADIEAAVASIMDASGFKSGTYTVDSDFNKSPGEYVSVRVHMSYTPMGIPPARVQASEVSATVKMLKEW